MFSTYQLFSQVTTTPALPTANNEIIITLDATGTGLDGYTGDVYAHTGVTINSDKWQNVIESWGNNSTQPKLTRDSSNTNLYTLLITPSVYSFYGVATTKTITELDFVFRASDGSKQTADIFVPIYKEGLNITITQPINESAHNLNSTITISAESSINADLELFVNDISQKTATNTKNISKPVILSSTGTYTIKAIATSGSETKETTITVFVKKTTQNKTRPSGVKNGFNNNGNGTATFVLLAPNKDDVFLIGDFNNWIVNENYQLFKDDDYFWITVDNLDTNKEYAYQYLVDYNIRIADPYSEKILDPWTDQYIKGENYPDLMDYPTDLTTGYVSTFKINESSYSWNVSNFTRPSQDNLIIYEMHIRDFVESDSYNEALTKLDYLENLGVNAIELMPVNEFEGADSWGYNPALYFALDKAYGTKNKFKEFVDECHRRGIAVLTDVVFNHSYGQSPLVQMYWNSADNKPAADNPWYNEDHNLVDNTSAHWGYDFNHESNYTVDFFNDVLSYWITEYKIDGFRFDFTKGFSNTIYTGSNNWASAYDASRISILKNYADHVWNSNPSNKPYVIFEHLSDNSEETELANYGIMLWGNMNHNYAENTMGWSGSTDITWMSYKDRGWNSPNVVGYMESHDEERIMYKNLEFGNSSNVYHNVKDLNVALSRQELAGMFFFTIPGPKMIWQFGELGYDISIDDPGRVDRKPIKWDYFDDVHRKHIYTTWSTLIEFKKQQPVFNTTDFTLDVENLTKTIILKDPIMDVVLVGNFDVTEQTISTTFPQTGTWYEYFTGAENDFSSTSQSLTLEPGEYRLFSSIKLLDPRGGTANDDSDNDGIIDTEDLCPNTMEGTTVNATGCTEFTLTYDNFSIETTSETCTGKENGQIEISASETLNYTATINGTGYSFTSSVTIKDLTPDTYELCISVDGESYEQCYSIIIEKGNSIEGKISFNSKIPTLKINSGTPPFHIILNNKFIFQTESSSININVKNGDYLQVKSAIQCEGVFSKFISINENITAFPNPTNGKFQISLPNITNEIIIEVYNIQSQLISSKIHTPIEGKASLDLENKSKGIYFVKINLPQPMVLKILKY